MTRILIACIALSLMISCERDEIALKEGRLEFTFSPDGALSGGRINQSASALLVTIEDAEGNVIHERKEIPLFKFGEGYLSEPIALTSGNFRLTEFIVLDENDVALYATPLEGSPLAYLVDDPLPIDFSITKNNLTKISPQVIKVEGNTSVDFGYATFSFDVTETFNFSVGIMTYNSANEIFELTAAHVTIVSGAETLFDMEVPALTHSIRIKDGYDSYTLSIVKEGYTAYESDFTATALKAYGTGSPLVITLLAQSLSDGLIAYYPFNGNANDESENDFHGIVHNAVLTTNRNGVPNSAYSFDGIDDYIQVLHDDALNLETDFSISLWTEVSDVQEAENGINDIIRKWTGNAEGYPFGISYLNPLADDAKEDRILYARYDGQLCDNVLETHSVTVTNNTFIHVVMIKEGGTIRHYLNNEMVAEVTDPTTCTTANTADITIGCRGNLVRFFKGKIDDIRIYDRALTKNEVAQLSGE